MVKKLQQKMVLILYAIMISGCQSVSPVPTLYEQLGGQQTINSITGYFILEIGYNEPIAKRFADSNLERFYEKLAEQLCMVTDGPCQYSGESMQVSHDGMNITEAEFNTVVDLLISAMNRTGVPHRLQTRLLARLAPLREEIIYR